MDGIKYRKPEEMKDSGVEWIGKIPSEWQVVALKRGMKVRNGRELIDEDKDVTKNINVYGSGGIFKYTSKYLYDGESVLFGRKGTIGKPLYVNERFWTVDTMYYSTFDLKKYLPKFTYYILQIYPWNIITTQTALPSVVGTAVENIKGMLPEIKDQYKIANFLDIKTTQFDSIIAKKELLIQKLEEAKKSLISEVVTGKVKIVNGEMVPRQPEEMKDSGVEWLGIIPKDWEVRQLKSIFIENKKKNIRGKESNVLSLSYGNIIRRNVESNFGLLPASFNTYQIVEPENLIFRLTDLQNDKRSLRVGLVKEKGIITSAYLGLVNKTSNSNEYLYYLYHTYDLLKVYYNMGGGLRQSSTFEDMKRLPTLVPPKHEQILIIAFIQNRIFNINKVIKTTNILVDRLKQAKQSLISEAVTGKIDLRDWEIIEEGGAQ